MILLLPAWGGASSAPVNEADRIPPLQETLQIVLEKNPEKSAHPRDRQDLIALVKRYYYQIQYKDQQLGIAEEVKKHFEKAITKAEEKYEEGEGDVTQSDLTKLKLGLSGSLNDIIKLKSDLEIVKLSLGRLMKQNLAAESEIAEDRIVPVDFPYKTFKDYLESLKIPGAGKVSRMGNKSPPDPGLAPDTLFEIHKSFLNVQKFKKKMELGRSNRRITRALLVTEVANYDFGIGDSGDLFEALIIYTRVLSGYYESIYDFNIAVVELDQLVTRALG